GSARGIVAHKIGKIDEDTENWRTENLDTIAWSYVSWLGAVVPPLVFTAIVVSIAKLRKGPNGGRRAGPTLLWLGNSARIAVAIGMTLGLITTPGQNTSIGSEHAGAPGSSGSWLDFLSGVVPANFLGLESSLRDDSVSLNFNVLQ